MPEEMDLHAKLNSWLNNSGYPLEMRVASIVRKQKKLAVRQGWHFIDPESGDSREIDVVCTARDIRGFAEVNFVIECKATNKPWVIFSSEDAADSYHRLSSFGLFSNDAHKAISEQIFSSSLENDYVNIDSSLIPWFKKDGLVGYSVAQAFDGNKDIPYNASLSCIKAATWLLSNSLWQNGSLPFTISFPIIVTSSPLFECSLNEEGESILKEINHGFLFFKQHVKNSKPTCISIVTENYLETFINECGDVGTFMIDGMSEACAAYKPISIF